MKCVRHLFLLFSMLAFLPNVSFPAPDAVNNQAENVLTEYLTVTSERRVIVKIRVPFEIDWNRISTVQYLSHDRGYPTHSGLYRDSMKFMYYPEYGYIGNDYIRYKIYDLNDKDKYIYKDYKIKIIKQDLSPKNWDFTIRYHCEDKSLHYTSGSSPNSFDLDIVNNHLGILDKIYDDHYVESYIYSLPRYTRIASDYNYGAFNPDQDSMRHHNIFKKNLRNNMSFTCNYSGGRTRIIFPVKYPVTEKYAWRATREASNDSFTKSRNDLFFYISSLSELHARVYLKALKNGNNKKNSLLMANIFMEKVFPGGHYTAETRKKYFGNNLPYDATYELINKFDEDNKNYYAQLSQLADDLTASSVSRPLDMIANNFETYYLKGYCKNEVICGIFFPEFTYSTTANPKFNKGLQYWSKRKALFNVAAGYIDLIKNEKRVDLRFTSNTPPGTTDPLSTVDLYQTKHLDSSDSVDNYYLYFELAEVFGGSEGGWAAYAGVNSSGFAGAYACFNDSYEKTMGCMAWSDHTNKFDWAWGSVRNGLDSSDTFYNVRLQEVVRRVNPAKERFNYKVSLGDLMKIHLPKIYNQRNKIKTIEYGVFATEFRYSDGSCYYCSSRVKAHEIKLLKKK